MKNKEDGRKKAEDKKDDGKKDDAKEGRTTRMRRGKSGSKLRQEAGLSC